MTSIGLLQTELAGATDAPGAELSFTTAAAWVAPEGRLRTFKDLLGV